MEDFSEFLKLPKREKKDRSIGLTMVMDKGLSCSQAEEMIDVSGHLIDFVKLGFGTSVFSNRVAEKIAIYKQNNIKPYLGGTLFEAFIKQNRFEDYLRLLDKWKLEAVEISDGSLDIPSDIKCEYIHKMAKNFCVLSEVGSKDAKVIIQAQDWVKMMNAELKAGSFKVIAEAREAGNVGTCNSDGSIQESLIEEIFKHVDCKDVLWEAPTKSLQVWFIKHFGTNVNLGNISNVDVIPLETLRNGLRGDTFYHFD